VTSGVIRTVTGDIMPDALGLTLAHEHLLCDITPPELAARGLPEVEITLENVFEIRHHWCRHPGNNRLDAIDVAVAELARFRAAGGSALVELTVQGIAPDPLGLRVISERAGVAVIAGCGWYTVDFAGPVLAAKTPAEMECQLIEAVEQGIDGTGVQAGIIGEIGCSWPLHALERKALIAAARAQAATGAAITIHPGRDAAAPHEILDVLESNGARPERVIIGHLDRTLFDVDEILRLAGRGSGLEWDFFGIESSYYPFAPIDLPNDGRRLELIRAVMDRGYGEQILIAHDICTKTRLRRFGGHGYAHILANVVPVMRRKGFTAAEVDLLLIDNPRRFLALS
jgi:phosphotriesterase-related protein